MITFTLPITPVPKGRPVFGKGFVRTPERTRHFENSVRLMSRPYQPEKPFLGAIKLEVTFFMKAPQRRKSEYPIGRPDIDNFCKSLCDSFNGIFWKDDSQVVILNAAKLYSYITKEPAIQISIEELDP